MSEKTSRAGVGERVFAGAIGLVFLVQFLMALRYPSDPRLFPLIVAGVGVLLSVAIVFGVGLHYADTDSPEPLSKPDLILALVVSPAYGFVLWLLGYWIASGIAIPLLAWLLGYRNRSVLMTSTISVVVVLGVLFPLLDVPLPSGFLMQQLFR
jgi:Tripartite tricarboxylate transporter TctB family